jgi:predicted HicB family RNase H-like nuclease
MPIAKRPQDVRKAPPVDDIAAKEWIEGAGKGGEGEPQRKPKKERVMIQFDQKVLERVDTAADRRGISRSAWIQFVVSQALDKGEG